MEEEHKWVFKKEFNSVKEFWNWQIKQNPIGNFDKFVFRGVSKSETYKLIPSAFRNDEKTNLPKIMSYSSVDCRIDNPSIENIVTAEFNSLVGFAREANKIGLYIPDSDLVSNAFLSTKIFKSYGSIKTWYDKSVLNLAALAQHHGVPTRMLDWTFDINIALYFALQGVIKEKYENETAINTRKIIDENYAIWGFNPYILKTYEDRFKAPCPIKIYIPNYWGNINAKSQKGILTYEETRIDKNSKEKFNTKPFQEVLFDYLQKVNREQIHIPANEFLLIKFVFHSFSPIVDFSDLTKQGYNAASIYNDYDGVKRKLDEDQWIRLLKY